MTEQHGDDRGARPPDPVAGDRHPTLARDVVEEEDADVIKSAAGESGVSPEETG